MLLSASICSVTHIVPNSAAMALPANMVAARTGPSSRTSVRLITAPIRLSMPIWLNWKKLWTAKTIPINIPVKPTTGRLKTPIWYAALMKVPRRSFLEDIQDRIWNTNRVRSPTTKVARSSRWTTAVRSEGCLFNSTLSEGFDISGVDTILSVLWP